MSLILCVQVSTTGDKQVSPRLCSCRSQTKKNYRIIQGHLSNVHINNDPVMDVTSTAAFAPRVTVHCTTRHALLQLLYAEDIVLVTSGESTR